MLCRKLYLDRILLSRNICRNLKRTLFKVVVCKIPELRYHFHVASGRLVLGAIAIDFISKYIYRCTLLLSSIDFSDLQLLTSHAFMERRIDTHLSDWFDGSPEESD